MRGGEKGEGKERGGRRKGREWRGGEGEEKGEGREGRESGGEGKGVGRGEEGKGILHCVYADRNPVIPDTVHHVSPCLPLPMTHQPCHL